MDIKFEERNGWGLILLNRPQVLNALTEEMCAVLDDKLVAWEQDSSIKAVLIEGAGDRAFCAGGDLKRFYGVEDAGIKAREFFATEYEMNQVLFHFTKPYVSFLKGVAMGGGLGVSIHGSHRIGTETLMMAMPETGIGLYPDVGATYFLSRMPNSIGFYLGLTGNPVNAAQAKACGLVTHFVLSEKLPALKESLLNAPDDVDGVLSKFSPNIDVPFEEVDVISRCFNQNSVEAILAALEKDGGEFALETKEILLSRSPTSLKVTLRALQYGEQHDFDECMAMEYHLSAQFLKYHDFSEGIRAVLIEKDLMPKWKPANLIEVDDAMVDAFFKQSIDYDQ